MTVEWFEKHETKGKEVDLETLVTLNPHILASSSAATNGQEETMPVPANLCTGNVNATLQSVPKESSTGSSSHRGGHLRSGAEVICPYR